MEDCIWLAVKTGGLSLNDVGHSRTAETFAYCLQYVRRSLPQHRQIRSVLLHYCCCHHTTGRVRTHQRDDKDWLWIGCLLPVVWLVFVLISLDLPYTKYWYKLAAWLIWPAVQLHSIWSPHMKSGWENRMNVESKNQTQSKFLNRIRPIQGCVSQDLKAHVWEWNDRARHLPNRLIWGSEVHAF